MGDDWLQLLEYSCWARVWTWWWEEFPEGGPSKAGGKKFGQRLEEDVFTLCMAGSAGGQAPSAA